MKATENELEAAELSCESWAWGCGGIVLIGLLLETAIAVAHPSSSSPWERAGTVIADLMVAVGVAGEILFSRMGFSRSRELQNRSSERMAEALQKAETERHARVKLEREIAPRLLTDEQAAILVEQLIGKIEPIYIITTAGAESWQYAWSFFSALSHAGLVESDGSFAGIFRHEFTAGMIGVRVLICSDKPDEHTVEVGMFMQNDPLVMALKSAGIKIESIGVGGRLKFGPLYRPHWKDGRRVLVVSEKPVPVK